MTDTTKLESAVAAARLAVKELESARDAELMQVRMKHSAAISAATSALSKAEWAVKEAISAGGAHPWEGKKVFYSKPVFASRWSSRQTGTERIYGVVEVCRVGTQFADNVSSWGRPGLGKPFVRLLKKDGTTGLKIDRDTRYGELRGWQLADEETAPAMPPAELKAAREALGLSLTGLAKALRMGKTGRDTVRAWEAADNVRGVPGPAQVAVECLLQHKDK